MSLLASEQILRIESLGDNCELGFVLRHLACEAGSLFRWTWIKPEQLLAVLDANFDAMYQFSNLVPFRNDMVTDTKYNVGWHSGMRSEMVDGQRRFVHDEAARRKFYPTELRKLRYLVTKFLARAKLGGLIYVIKCNDGIADRTIDAIFAALSRIADGADFVLLTMSATPDPAKIGTVIELRPRLLRGHVSRFAPYDQANAVDFQSWTRVLDEVIRRSPCADWSDRLRRLRGPETGLALAFPFAKSQDFSKPILGDLRAGTAVLLNGNAWCRQVDDCFRLHGAPPGQAATILRWTGVHLPGPWQLATTLHCPVDDSLALDVAVTVKDERGSELARWHDVVTPTEPKEVAIEAAPNDGQAVDIELAVHSCHALKQGERAVVDISTLSLSPRVSPLHSHATMAQKELA